MPDSYGWIWPKDPRPGNPTHWPRRWRWLDLLTNRGPDIFVGRLRQTRNDTKGKARDRDRDRGRKVTAPTRWSRWELEHNIDESNIHPAFRTSRQDKAARDKSPFPWARRQSAERYDFRTKRYCIPDSGTWSRVQYCNAGAGAEASGSRQNHVVPVRYWDRNGNEYPAGYWHDVVYGPDRCDRRCRGSRSR